MHRVGLFYRVLPTYLLVGGLFMLPIWQKHMANLEAWQSARTAQTQLDLSKARPSSPFMQGKPTRIVMPRLGIDLPIVTGSYNNNAAEWSVAGIVANYADNTAYINNRHDKTLIYGHWTSRVFGNTKNLKTSDVAYVYTDNGHVFKYRYVNKKVIAPTDVAIFKEFKGKPGLVVMTCEGSWAQHRRMMYFNLVGSS